MGALELICFGLSVFLLSTSSCYARHMNVLFLVSDDLRPQLGCYEGPDSSSNVSPKMNTPNLDALAAKSLLLKRAYAQVAVCSPSRSSLLTGRRPDTTNVYNMQHYFRKVGGNFTTLPQYFKQQGYTSIGMGKIFHTTDALSIGNDDVVSWSVPHFHGIDNFEYNRFSWKAIPDKDLKDKPLRDEQVTLRAIDTLRNASLSTGDKPFFLAVGFHKPHFPLVFPESFLNYYPENEINLPNNPYAPKNMPLVAWFNYLGFREKYNLSQYSGEINTTFADATTLAIRRAYYATTTWMDSLVGRIITELDAQGLANNTIISFFGDHGFQLGEHGEWAKQTNFEIATRVPMMLHIPGLTDKGVQSRQLTELIDLFPTLVDAAGLPPLPICSDDSSNTALCREGASLLPLIQHPDIPIKNAAFSQFPRVFGGKKLMGYSIRTDQYRYTEWPTSLDDTEFYDSSFDWNSDIFDSKFTPNWSDLVGTELYDHTRDPDENYNRADDHAYKSAQKQLSQQLHDGWRAAVVQTSGSTSNYASFAKSSCIITSINVVLIKVSITVFQ